MVDNDVMADNGVFENSIILKQNVAKVFESWKHFPSWFKALYVIKKTVEKFPYVEEEQTFKTNWGILTEKTA